MTSSNDAAELQSYLQRMRDDEAFALSQLITIKTKTGEPKPFELWPSQRKYLKHKSRINDVIKIRQQGFSVLSVARRMAMARLALFFPELQNRQATIFVKDDADAPIMFNHARFMDARLPEAFQGEKEHDAAKVIHYRDTNWVIRIMTAGKTESAAISKGRSSTDPYPHLTECGYIENLALLLGGLLGSMPDYGELIMESTSSGPRGFFSQHFLGTMQNGKEIDENVWAWEDRRAFFFGFIEHPEYVKPVIGPFDTKDEEEERLMGLGATPERIAWRRSKVADYGKQVGGVISPELQFKRDYPATIQDAFEEAGGAFFNQKTMVMVRDWAKHSFPEPLIVGLKMAEGDGIKPIPPTNANRFHIWRLPAKGWRNRYVSFWDCGQGRPDGDFDSGGVLDLVTGEVVAMAYGRYGAEIAVPLAVLLAAYYGNALLAWDATGIGAEWRPLLQRSSYPNVYARYRLDKQVLDPYSYGHLWTEQIKSDACSSLRNNIERRQMLVPDGEFYNEQQYFSYQDEGDANPEAATGFHDDIVMMLAGLSYVAERAPRPTPETPAPNMFTDKRKLDLKKMMSQARKGQDFATKLAESL